MDNSVRIAKIERAKAQEAALKEFAIALIKQPGTGLLIAAIAINGARQARLLTDVQAGLIQGVLIAATGLEAFRPLTLGLS